MMRIIQLTMELKICSKKTDIKGIKWRYKIVNWGQSVPKFTKKFNLLASETAEYAQSARFGLLVTTLPNTSTKENWWKLKL